MIGAIKDSDPMIVDHERAARQAHLQQAESDGDAVPLDASAAQPFGRVATIALAHALPVYTCIPGDFTRIDGLEVVAVPVPLVYVTPVEGSRGQRHVLQIGQGL